MLVNGTYHETHGIEECPRRAGVAGMLRKESGAEEIGEGCGRDPVPSGFSRLDTNSRYGGTPYVDRVLPMNISSLKSVQIIVQLKHVS